jgi:hypothetical protein
MGLFDAFKKKDCEICGKEVGMFGYKKLEDGEICKDCVKLLSPFFDYRRHATVDQIKAQLAYREQNQRDLALFQHSLVLGQEDKMFVELQNGVPTRFTVSRYDDYKGENADIIPFTNVSSFRADIREHRNEIKYNNEQGERVSYNPPRYEYNYDFYIKLDIANIPWFDDISLKINPYTVELETVQQQGMFGGMMSGRAGFDPMLYPEYRQFKAICDEICDVISCGQRRMAVGGMQSAPMGMGGMNTAPMGMGAAPMAGQGYTAPVTAPAPQATPVSMAGVQGWTCSCGNVNQGKFCMECGAQKPAGAPLYRCDKCGWQPENPHNPPKFCMNCGDPFDSNDIR